MLNIKQNMHIVSTAQVKVTTQNTVSVIVKLEHNHFQLQMDTWLQQRGLATVNDKSYKSLQ